MIIKKLLNKIEINKYTLILLFLSLITGLFKEIEVIFIILLFHELGHFIAAKFLKWNVKKIIFYPFGGLTIFEEKIDKPLKEEFFITIMGPVFQIITYIVCKYMYEKYLLSEYTFSLIKNYHYGILLFNLLPIVPLDGSKILNIFLNKFINFRKSFTSTIYISIIVLIIGLFYVYNDASYYILIIFLIYQIFINIKNKNFIYQRFILEKGLYPTEYFKYKKVKDVKNMYRNKKHLIYKNNMYITEKKMFNNISNKK